MSSEPKKFDQWAIVDVMGHQRFVGKATEEVVAGCGFVRIDIPQTKSQPGWSKLVGTGSIYAITPVSEEIARQMAEGERSAPVQPYDLPRIESRIPDDSDEWDR